MKIIASAALALFVAVTTGCAASADTDEALGTTTQAQTREHILLARQRFTNDMTSLARSMGTSDGRIVFPDADRSSLTLVADDIVYVAGTSVEKGKTRFMKCQDIGEKEPVCHIVAPVTDPTAFDCGPGPDGDTSCQCAGVLDCFDMILSDACVEGTVSCDGASCTCDF
jgi:hypothetical protein